MVATSTVPHSPNLSSVLAFCAAWRFRDVDRITAFLAEDAEWENVPIETLRGRPAIAARLGEVMARIEAIEFVVLDAAESADGAVLTERVDRIVTGGRTVELRLMGMFRVREGRITLWRDYFDLAQYRAQLGR